ncbi:hypothetical protein G6O67_000301 [Ophiocordyceps sinensis]|uniref:RRN6 beta-propeller domain-containing protein n=1 Tax=Ophiocordyceps sinensis TaxID=72228 RepID=A0A8H4PYY3_9HYPO|nr:hypothetical protein G6O67_000301 [Ophiocordyceps sinensis]
MDHPWPPIARAPAGDAEDGPGLLHTSRLTASTPHFDIVGSSAELYPPSNTRVSSQLPPARRLQEQWLLDTHPEAFMGNQIFKDYLKEEMERFGQLEETTQRRPLLAVGLMSNRGDASTPEALPVLAVATGSCGEQLRLTRMDDSQWQWGKNTEAILHLTIVTSIHKEEGAVWATDPVPISQVKAVEYTPNGSFRWLLVQKPAWTAILEPEYHPFAVLDHDAADSTHQRPSYINPNPLLTLHHQETGGNAHSDVCFNPPASERPPQLTILDECGYWTIWNVLETRTFNKKTLRLSQYMCGHIREGFLPTIPSQSAYPAMRPGSSYLRHGLNFFQVSILGEDLGVRYCICTTSTGPVSEISLPDKPIRRSGNKQQRRWTRKYNRGLRRTREPFVVPDGMETDEAGEAPQQNSGDDSSGDSADDSSGDSADEPSWEAAIREQIDVALAQGKSRVPAELFDITQRILKDGLRNGSLPLTTWAEVAEGIEQPTAYFADDAKIDESAEHLLSISDERTFVGPLRKHEPNAPLGVAALKQQLSDFWLESGGGNPSTRLERARETQMGDIVQPVAES